MVFVHCRTFKCYVFVGYGFSICCERQLKHNSKTDIPDGAAPMMMAKRIKKKIDIKLIIQIDRHVSL